MAQQQPVGKRTATREIPDKLYFRIGEVARLCEVPAYVLRFWETEFPQLKPNKGGTGQRLFRRRDVEMALRIKTLLYDEGYTIPGARQVFKAEKSEARTAPKLEVRSEPKAEFRTESRDETKATGPQLTLGMEASRQGVDPTRLQKLRQEMQDLLRMLDRPPAGPDGAGMTLRVVRGARQLETGRGVGRLFQEPIMFPDGK